MTHAVPRHRLAATKYASFDAERMRRCMQITPFFAWLLFVSPVDAAFEIYRCSTDAGPVEFTDRPCIGGESAAPSAGTGLALPALTPVEAQRVAELADQTRRRTEETRREATRIAARRAKADRDDRAACSRATEALDGLRTKRRRGYRLVDDQKLKDDELRYSAMKRTHCGRQARRVTSPPSSTRARMVKQVDTRDLRD